MSPETTATGGMSEAIRMFAVRIRKSIKEMGDAGPVTGSFSHSSFSARGWNLISIWMHPRCLNGLKGAKPAIDFLISGGALMLAYVLRFDGWPPADYARVIWRILPLVLFGQVAANFAGGAYRRFWRYTSTADLLPLGTAAASVSVSLLLFRLCTFGGEPVLAVPLGIIFLDFFLVTFGMTAARILRRISLENEKRAALLQHSGRQRVLLAGAGDEAIMMARSLIRHPELGLHLCGFVDDGPARQGKVIEGIKVQGGIRDLPELIKCHRIQQVILAMPKSSRADVQRVLDICAAAAVSVRILPSFEQILGGGSGIPGIRPLRIEDLLGRETIDFTVWQEASRSSYAGKRILVTGGGGSIGRELCRQVAALDPAEIILLDKDENAIFEAERELRPILQARNIVFTSVIADLKRASRLQQVFSHYRPQVVLHAAAHKHVPLMELNVGEAVLNNILGTAVLLRACRCSETERCVMVSTDKAVNPTSIMGATKRVAELMFQAQAALSDGSIQYSCVRFGNVLGSRGSVVPVFHEQVLAGGPVTVTHPDMVRYFMTIKEAAQLIIQAGTLGRKGEIFLLDMGEPVKVLDLAKDVIRLSGLTPGRDIDIEFVGIRPGEKLREELLIAGEGTMATRFEKIFMAPPLGYDYQLLNRFVRRLSDAALIGDEQTIIGIFHAMDIGFGSRSADVQVLQAPANRASAVLVETNADVNAALSCVAGSGEARSLRRLVLISQN